MIPRDFSKELSVAGVIVALIIMDYLKIDDAPLKYLLMGLVPTIIGYSAAKSTIPALQPDPPVQSIAVARETPPVSQ